MGKTHFSLGRESEAIQICENLRIYNVKLLTPQEPKKMLTRSSGKDK